MKKIFLPIFFLALSGGISSVIFADNTIVTTEPATTQEYHVASDNAVSTAQSIQPAQSSSVVATQPTPTVSSTANSAGIDTSLQAQLSQLNQEILLYQQQSDQRIESVASKNDMVMSELNNLNQVTLQLSREVNALRAAQAELTSIRNQSAGVTHSSALLWQQWFAWLEKLGTVGYLNFALIAILLFTLGFGLSKFRRSVPVTAKLVPAREKNIPSVEEQDDTKDEYNFMSTNEAIPAILDLARAYVAMEDFQKAKIALQKVLEKGNNEQCTEAKVLFSKIR